MTEKLTIMRVGPEKTIEYTNKKTGKPDSFKKVGFQAEEYGERWFDLTFRGECPIKVGDSREFDISERAYTTQAGEERTSWDARLPRTGGGAGMSEAQYGQLMTTMNAILTECRMIRGLVDTKTSDGKNPPGDDEGPW